MSGEPPRWARGGERVLASTRVLELRSVHFRHPGRKTERDYVVAHAPDWVNVVALASGDRLVLVRQFRFGSNELSLEIPGGVIEAGETPLAAGMRELSEETGYGGGAARLLRMISRLAASFDAWVVGAMLQIVAGTIWAVSIPVRMIQSGSLRSYMFATVMGLIGFLGYYLYLARHSIR